MKEIRLTFSADDFAAVSQALLGMGIGFRVEPVTDAPAEAAPDRPGPPSTILRRRAAKKVAKSGSKRASKRDEPLVTAADRLRNALARKSGTADLGPSGSPSGPQSGPQSGPMRSPAPEGVAEIVRSAPPGERDA